jgi:hypothetical protein
LTRKRVTPGGALARTCVIANEAKQSSFVERKQKQDCFVAAPVKRTRIRATVGSSQ